MDCVQLLPKSTKVEINDDILKQLKNPFGEDYFTKTDFYTKVFATFNKIQKREKEVEEEDANISKATWREIEKRFRLELKDRYKNADADGAKITWKQIEKRYRLEDLKGRYESDGDPLVVLMTKAHDDYKQLLKDNNSNEDFNDVFMEALSEFADILLEEDYNGKINNHEDYQDIKAIDVETKQHYNTRLLEVINPYNDKSEEITKTTILHIAAKRDLCHVAETYLRLYPKSMTVKDKPPNNGTRIIAVEVALKAGNDKVCELLITKMLNARVRKLFQGEEHDAAEFKLAELVAKGDMKKTVVAVLNSCVNPHLPYIQKQPDEREDEEQWSNLPSMPLQYNFKFQILDGDYEGRLPGHKKAYNISSPSCFQVITNCANTDETQDPIKHMAVRQLVHEKWEKYGKQTIWVQGGCYVLYLIALSIALFFGGKSEDPRKYASSRDKARAVFEIISLVFTMFYLLTEVAYIIKEMITKIGKKYGVYLPWLTIFHPPKIIYIVALLGIIALVPCHLVGLKTPARSIACVAYIIIFMQLFYYFPLIEEYGTYANTFIQIIKVDIKQFLVVIVVVVMAFSGSVYMAMSASNSFDKAFDNFWTVLLQELRAIFEGKEFSDSYENYHVALTLLILASMFCIIVIMGNILIGQISERYTAAKTIATIQCDIDRAKMITRNERSVFPFLQKQRKTHFKVGLYVSNQDLISGLIRDAKTYYSSMDEETDQAVKALIKKNILKESL